LSFGSSHQDFISGGKIMTKNALAVAETSNNQPLQKSKPRYTEAENKILFESWWNPQKRRELVNHLGRKMSALRSQFCRLLKEKGLSNQDYYNMMQSKYTNESGIAPRKRSRELKSIDRTILETFCRHQAQGNSRAMACDELQKKLGTPFTPAALKLRFYRLIKRLQYSDEDLLQLGKQILGETSRKESLPQTKTAGPLTSFEPVSTIPVNETIPESVVKPAIDSSSDNSFFYQLSSLPNTIRIMEDKINGLEEKQRHQLDLRGFIEHLLAVERDLKREDKLLEEIQHLMDENESIRGLAEKERERLKKREEELAEVYKILETMLSDFMRLESVSKLASLGDFMHRLEITVDQFGNVLKSKRIPG
jgi:hypothetical protein